jgi:hypothetical protein
MDWLDDPDLLWHHSRLGREEYVQRLLATLILGEEARGWNVRRSPSERGASFLCDLHRMHHADTPAESPIFVDEFELPARHDAERAGWPDHGVEWRDRLFLIELKTERRSHRPGQLEHYLELAAHHHPDRAVDLLYLTPTMEAAPPQQVPDGASYAHSSWRAVMPLIEDTWNRSPIAWERTVAERLGWWSEQLEQGAPLPVREIQPSLPSRTDADASTASQGLPSDAEAAADDPLLLAARVQVDGKQRGIEAAIHDPTDLEELRLELRDQLRTGPEIEGTAVTHVRPWIWRAATSGGQALTEIGRETGYELRLSRYREAQDA